MPLVTTQKKKAHVEAIHTSSVHQMIGNIDIIEMLLMLYEILHYIVETNFREHTCYSSIGKNLNQGYGPTIQKIVYP